MLAADGEGAATAAVGLDVSAVGGWHVFSPFVFWLQGYVPPSPLGNLLPGWMWFVLLWIDDASLRKYFIAKGLRLNISFCLG
jgi:hypothetical protein